MKVYNCSHGNAEERTDGCGVYKYNHVHELLGSTQLAETGRDRHNHRFATISGPAISRGKSHVHQIHMSTDFAGHFHEVSGTTGPAVAVSGSRHVHFFEAVTGFSDGHTHNLIASVLIQNPLNIE